MDAAVDLFSLPAFAPEHRGGPRELADKLVSEAAEAFAEIRGYLVVANDPEAFFLDEDLEIARVGVADELADVLQVARNVCDACGIGRGEMEEALEACVRRNERRGRY